MNVLALTDAHTTWSPASSTAARCVPGTHSALNTCPDHVTRSIALYAPVYSSLSAEHRR